MKSFDFRFRKVLSLLAFASLAVLGVMQQSSATNINTVASICTMFGNLPATDIVYVPGGVLNNQSTFRYVSCAVPRSPLASGATSGGFWIDGDNPAGTSTSCSLASFDYTGTLVASKAPAELTAAHYDAFVSFTAAEIPYYAYVSLVCKLPPGGFLRGVTAVQ